MAAMVSSVARRQRISSQRYSTMAASIRPKTITEISPLRRTKGGFEVMIMMSVEKQHTSDQIEISTLF